MKSRVCRALSRPLALVVGIFTAGAWSYGNPVTIGNGWTKVSGSWSEPYYSITDGQYHDAGATFSRELFNVPGTAMSVTTPSGRGSAYGQISSSGFNLVAQNAPPNSFIPDPLGVTALGGHAEVSVFGQWGFLTDGNKLSVNLDMAMAGDYAQIASWHIFIFDNTFGSPQMGLTLLDVAQNSTDNRSQGVSGFFNHDYVLDVDPTHAYVLTIMASDLAPLSSYNSETAFGTVKLDTYHSVPDSVATAGILSLSVLVFGFFRRRIAK